MRFRIRVPEKFGDIVYTETKFVENIPVYLRLQLVEENGEKKLQVGTVPVRLTQLSIRMKWKVKIFHDGARIMEKSLDFEFTKMYVHSTVLDGTLKDGIELLMEGISMESVQNENFEVLRFELDGRPTNRI